MPMDLGRWAPTQYSRRCSASDALRGAAAHGVLQPQCGAVRRAAIVSGFRTRRSRHCPPAPVGVLRRRRLASFIMCRAIMPLAGVCADRDGMRHAMRCVRQHQAQARDRRVLLRRPVCRRRAARLPQREGTPHRPTHGVRPRCGGLGVGLCATDRGCAHVRVMVLQRTHAAVLRGGPPAPPGGGRAAARVRAVFHDRARSGS